MAVFSAISSLTIELGHRIATIGTMLGAAIVSGHWLTWHGVNKFASKETRERLAVPTARSQIRAMVRHYPYLLLGVFCLSIGWWMHQTYWLYSWLYVTTNGYAEGILAFHKAWGWIVGLSEAIIIFGSVAVLSVYFRTFTGKYWPLVGLGIPLLLFAMGVSIGHPAAPE